MKSAKDVANDIQKWIDGGSRPDEWKMGEWVRVLESFSPEVALIEADKANPYDAQDLAAAYSFGVQAVRERLLPQPERPQEDK